MIDDTPTIVDKAVFLIDGENCQASVIVHEHAFWLVATWLEKIDTGRRYPDRIVPLDQFLPDESRASPIRLGLSVPRELLFVDCPQAALEKYRAQTHPCAIQFPTHGGMH